MWGNVLMCKATQSLWVVVLRVRWQSLSILIHSQWTQIIVCITSASYSDNTTINLLSQQYFDCCVLSVYTAEYWWKKVTNSCLWQNKSGNISIFVTVSLNYLLTQAKNAHSHCFKKKSKMLLKQQLILGYFHLRIKSHSIVNTYI